MLRFSDTVISVEIAGNMALDGAISAPNAEFRYTGSTPLSKWLYGKKFYISGNVTAYSTIIATP